MADDMNTFFTPSINKDLSHYKAVTPQFLLVTATGKWWILPQSRIHVLSAVTSGIVHIYGRYNTVPAMVAGS